MVINPDENMSFEKYHAEKEFQKDIDELILLTKKIIMEHGIDDALRTNLKHLEDMKKEGLGGL
jgi:hypothetical protein